MPVGQDYITKTYSALKDNLEGFSKTPDQFKSLITSDPAYRQKVYSALRDNITGFDKTPETFDSLINVSQKKIFRRTVYRLAQTGNYKPQMLAHLN